jgi:hypothetical protein
MCFFQIMFLMVYNVAPHCSIEFFLADYPELNKFGSPTYVVIFKPLQNGELLWNGRPGLHPRKVQCVSEFTTVFRPSLGSIVIRFLPSRHSGTCFLKWQEHEAEHSEIFSAEVKNSWSYISNLPIPVATATARLLRLPDRTPSGPWKYVAFECRVLSGGDFCHGPIPLPEESNEKWLL